MMHGFESLMEGEVRDVSRGHRIDSDSPPDLDFGEDPGQALAPIRSIASTRRRLFAVEVRRFVPWFRTTFAPSRAKVRAMLLPMPSPVLPVTRATRPSRGCDMPPGTASRR